MIRMLMRMVQEKKTVIQNYYMVCTLMSAVFFFMDGRYLEGLTSLLFFGAIFCPVFGLTYPNLMQKKGDRTKKKYENPVEE